MNAAILAEEATESQHTQLKKYRTHHARKRSRVDNLHDVFIRAMNHTDLLINSIWMRRQNKMALNHPDILKGFMVFKESVSCSINDTDNDNALEELMKDVDKIEEDFV